MRTPVGRGSITIVLAVALLVVLPLIGSAASAASSAEVTTTLEAWFRSSPVDQGDNPLCTTPLGCPPALVPPASPYPEGTLHVGATSGQADAVTYVAFGTSALPSGATLTGGTATLPVAATEDGTVAADTAVFQACLVAQPFGSSDGDPIEEAPEPDCDVSAPARYVADADPPAFEVDLAAFVTAWTGAGAITGLALVPVEDGAGTWHVAFSRRDREQPEAAPPITARLTYEAAGAGAPGQAPGGTTGGFGGDRTFSAERPPSSGGLASGPSVPIAADPTGGEAAPQVAGAAPSGSDASASPPTQPIAALAAPLGYPYPVVWLLPLALALGGLLLVRSLSGDVEVLGDDDERDLIGRLWLAFFPDRTPAG